MGDGFGLANQNDELMIVWLFDELLINNSENVSRTKRSFARISRNKFNEIRRISVIQGFY